MVSKFLVLDFQGLAYLAMVGSNYAQPQISSVQ